MLRKQIMLKGKKVVQNKLYLPVNDKQKKIGN